MGKKKTEAAESMGELLRCPPGPIELSRIPTGATPGILLGKRAVAEQLPRLAERLATLQEQLYAWSTTTDTRRVLLVLQGMDTAGKGGVVNHVVGAAHPYGTRLTSFKSPTKEELSHDFLWRIRRALPEAGQLGVFDRSHYEDVLIARVHDLVPEAVWSERYDKINHFEQKLVADGCVIVKCFLHVSKETQKERLMARLDDPTKHWKYNPADVDERMLWPDYQAAYEAALEKCNTAAAPWYIVPSDRKWYRNYAVMRLLIEAFERLDLTWPPADFDIAAQKGRVAAS